MKRRVFGQSGFSLLEVLAAFTILTMMVAVVYGILFVSRQTQRAHEKKLEQFTLIRGGLEKLERDLSMAYLSLGEDQLIPERRTYFKARPDAGGTSLAFSTFSHVRTSKNAKEADNCIVEYTYMDDPMRPGSFVLRRRETNRLEHKVAQEIPGRTLGLIPGVSMLTMEFYDQKNDQWLDEWDTTVDEGRMNKLPN
ncbi:prepilin-type N-terminal cleavage/methylation domain-containing protein, partial [Myxococcota bacterium]|nr:prepilin-type N-terminal cleavage/methylation domain-containing protein [Myxococcota bacterium]